VRAWRSADQRRTYRVDGGNARANDVRYRRPAFVGDTVTPQFIVTAVEPKDGERGILRLSIKLHNQRNELVLEGTHILMLKRHGAHATATTTK